MLPEDTEQTPNQAPEEQNFETPLFHKSDMNRNDLQTLSRIRVKEAKLLLDNGYFSGAYYLLGYSVECALKACIAKQVMRYGFPDKQLTTGAYTHNLEHLITTARLKDELTDEIRNDPDFQTNWLTVKAWSEQSRYIHETREAEARNLYSVCTARGKGVLVSQGNMTTDFKD